LALANLVNNIIFATKKNFGEFFKRLEHDHVGYKPEGPTHKTDSNLSLLGQTVVFLLCWAGWQTPAQRP